MSTEETRNELFRLGGLSDAEYDAEMIPAETILEIAELLCKKKLNTKEKIRPIIHQMWINVTY